MNFSRYKCPVTTENRTFLVLDQNFIIYREAIFLLFEQTLPQNSSGCRFTNSSNSSLSTKIKNFLLRQTNYLVFEAFLQPSLSLHQTKPPNKQAHPEVKRWNDKPVLPIWLLKNILGNTKKQPGNSREFGRTIWNLFDIGPSATRSSLSRSLASESLRNSWPFLETVPIEQAVHDKIGRKVRRPNIDVQVRLLSSCGR